MTTSDIYFLAMCVQHLLTHGPHTLSDDQMARLDRIRAGDCPPPTLKQPVVVAKEGARKRTKAASVCLQLPTGTQVCRTVGAHTFQAIWNNDERSLTWGSAVFPSPTAFCKAVYAHVHGAEKPHEINGWKACYVLRDGKRVTLDALRSATTTDA